MEKNGTSKSGYFLPTYTKARTRAGLPVFKPNNKEGFFTNKQADPLTPTTGMVYCFPRLNEHFSHT
jgi:hypothetical protein